MQSMIVAEKIPEGLLAALASREITLWLHKLPAELDARAAAAFARLPWREVFITDAGPDLVAEIGRDDDADLVRKRGFVQLVQNDPSLIALPPRALPVYILGTDQAGPSTFEESLRRMSMLGVLRRSNVRRLVVVSDEDATPPQDLAGLIDASFHPYVTFASITERGESQASAWAQSIAGGPPVQLVRQAPAGFVVEVTRRYHETYPSDKTLARVRQADGSTILLDLTDADDPERPVLANYDLIQERDLAAVSPEELSEAEFGAFFEGTEVSWRPHAAGVPWLRDSYAFRPLERLLRRLDTVGSSENKIAYVSSEPGAGGTTYVRQLAWEAARAGYPVLVAKSVPFAPDALPVVTFLTQIHQAQAAAQEPTLANGEVEQRLYEAPCVIVFDREHWEFREGELRHFVKELERSGRPALAIVVTGPIKPIAFYSEATAREIAVLTHLIDSTDAVKLGRHLNAFLRVFGKERTDEEWMRFYNQHKVRHIGSSAAFWIALSFWLKSSKELTGSIQEWIYEAFTKYGGSLAQKSALVEIAALSTVRLALSEGLLPKSDNEWPLGIRLEDERQHLSALGLTRASADGQVYWGLAHDILGRLLINALFYDHPTRIDLGYGEATDAEHLRFLALRRIATKPAMSELRYRALADEFATVIFKVDPDHGAYAFANIWRQVLEALDAMPKLLRDTSRLYRHHTAISRRRIAKLEGPIYDVLPEDKLVLLERAIQDIQYAITSVVRAPTDEPDLNLYNSLANAYLDLADAKASMGSSREEVTRLRILATDATHRAYIASPTNPYVVETHIKNLLSIGKTEPAQAVSSSLEALQAIYEAMRGGDSMLRTPQLTRLADQALDLLFAYTAPDQLVAEPQTAIDVLVQAWRILTREGSLESRELLADVPIEVANEALSALEHAAGRGDVQVLRLRYGLLSAASPFAFARRLELIENLQATDVRLSPQLQLEYALLLYQVGRAVEGDARFQELRRLWRSSEHFVRVPEPLDWLREGESVALRAVQGVVGSDQSHRSVAKVQEFSNRTAPFRLEEFGVRGMRAGSRFRAHVSFGHNGPFLRPLGARPKRG